MYDVQEEEKPEYCSQLQFSLHQLVAEILRAAIVAEIETVAVQKFILPITSSDKKSE